MKKIKVLKFGGTSLKNKEDRLKVMTIIKEELKNYKVVVVLSAIGRYPFCYATDTFLSLSGNLSNKEKDQLIVCGELISTHLFASECLREQLNCRVLNISENGIKTDECYLDGTIIHVDTNTIYKTLSDCDFVVVPGFFGTNKYHLPTSLGRGGSDLSAIAIAYHLGLDEVTIYSDVEGVFSCDPKQLEHPYFYNHLSISQMQLLSHLGVGLLQDKACDYVLKHPLRLVLKSTFKNDHFTIIDKKGPFKSFIVSKKDGYIYINDSQKIFYLKKNLSLSQLHTLFIEKNIKI